MNRDFSDELNRIFQRHRTEVPAVPVVTPTIRFDVVKMTAEGERPVEMGVTFLEALGAINGRCVDRGDVKYKVVPVRG